MSMIPGCRIYVSDAMAHRFATDDVTITTTPVLQMDGLRVINLDMKSPELFAAELRLTRIQAIDLIADLVVELDLSKDDLLDLVARLVARLR